ncbi:MAG: PD40 domain-containing protein [Phycisphaerae bacterium]|nr:PD40 domain-containing protein [Phycisphaerae bacterium]
MKKRFLILLVAALAVWTTSAAIEYILRPGARAAANAPLLPEPTRIHPDYTDNVIPPNIAPLNFRIEERARRYFVRIGSDNGRPINILTTDACIHIPARRWRRLLEANRGNPLTFDIYLNQAGRWNRCQTITNTIASEPIDSHLAYRLINPLYNYWSSVGIYQRNLTTFKQSEILHGRSYDDGCVNCHTFLNNDPAAMFLGVRSGTYGSATLHTAAGSVEKIGSKWGYTAWHPSGRLAAYSVNATHLFFQAAGMEVRDVVDLDSVMTYYDLRTQTVKTTPGLADKDRLETYPAWSPDGKYLYFCSAPILWTDRKTVPPENFEKVRYDLRRIAYDLETDTWGEPETVLSAEETGKSILLPRITPDGRFLVFCLCDYGCFPIYQPSSDLYVMDLADGAWRKLDINSEFSESWHSFSTNGRWMAFSSRRQAGLFTRTYFSYIDLDGKFHKPFVLPQQDPDFYDSCIQTFSVPELISGPVSVSPRKLAQAVRDTAQVDVQLPVTGATKRPDPAQYPERE